MLQANVGGRIIRPAKDAFGVYSFGGDQNKGEIFLIFRGATSANNGAGWVSNAKIGFEISETGLPVHIGFNLIFKSMIPEIKQVIDGVSGQITKIHCIGHSLSGAVASFASDWVQS